MGQFINSRLEGSPLNATFLLGFTPCKVEKPLRGLELQEKEEEKAVKDIGKLFRNSTKKQFVYKKKEKQRMRRI